MHIGYARVSTDDQNLDIQLQELRKAGCKRIFQEKISGTKRQRPELAKLLEQLREDDSVTVLKLDRLARSIRDLLDINADKIISMGKVIRTEDADYFRKIAQLSNLAIKSKNPHEGKADSLILD